MSLGKNKENMKVVFIEVVRGFLKNSYKELGQKELAYEIKKHKSGYYFLINVESNVDAINEFDRVALISEEIIRHLIVKLDK